MNYQEFRRYYEYDKKFRYKLLKGAHIADEGVVLGNGIQKRVYAFEKMRRFLKSSRNAAIRGEGKEKFYFYPNEPDSDPSREY